MKIKTRKERKKAHAKMVSGIYNKKRNEKNQPLIKEILKHKGKKFTGLFSCVLCRHTRAEGYVYTIENNEYEICKFCYDSLFGKKKYIKIIYTPMGNNHK